jgi:hypothetical protein
MASSSACRLPSRIAPAALTCSAACSKGTIAAAFAARFSTPAEKECRPAQFSSASCGHRFPFPLLR